MLVHLDGMAQQELEWWASQSLWEKRIPYPHVRDVSTVSLELWDMAIVHNVWIIDTRVAGCRTWLLSGSVGYSH